MMFNRHGASLLRISILELLDRIKNNPRTGRATLMEEAAVLLNWRQVHQVPGLWQTPPLMITATLDDAWGHGLEVIHLYAEAAGVHLIRLGLMREPDQIISACQTHRPDLLGLTVLQFDSEESLAEISRRIPPETQIIAGGPIFKADADAARRAGIDRVVKDAADFMVFLMDFRPP
jgi:methylmalonyl-CoA mutase cobalamin-binding subunit